MFDTAFPEAVTSPTNTHCLYCTLSCRYEQNTKRGCLLLVPCQRATDIAGVSLFGVSNGATNITRIPISDIPDGRQTSPGYPSLVYPARGKHQRGNPLLVFFEFYLFWSVRHRRLPTKGGYLLDCVLGRVKVSTLALDYSIATADYGSKSFTDSFKQEFSHAHGGATSKHRNARKFLLSKRYVWEFQAHERWRNKHIMRISLLRLNS